jgi:GxxExxY protein
MQLLSESQADPNKTSGMTGEIIRCALAVHSALGPGLLESAYEACLAYELRAAGLAVQTQVALPVQYREVRLDVGYRIDLLVENAVIVELKLSITSCQFTKPNFSLISNYAIVE